MPQYILIYFADSLDESMAKIATLETSQENLEDESIHQHDSSSEEMNVEEPEVSSSMTSGASSCTETHLSETDLSLDDDEPAVIK